MRFLTTSFRHADIILSAPKYKPQYDEIISTIAGISDEDLIARHESFSTLGSPPKSISRAINELLKERFEQLGWDSEPPIFQGPGYSGNRWRLDFAKEDISIEVAFNHGEAVAWNLLKPVLASELNHIDKAIQTELGVIISATQRLKVAGGFDGAVGTYEKFLEYLVPLRNVLNVPILLIGLEAPITFRIIGESTRKGERGDVQRLED